MDALAVILGNILMLIGQLVIIYASSSQNKIKILFMQLIAIFFIIIANLLLKGYSAVVVNVLAIVRNLLTIYGLGNRFTSVLLLIAAVVLGVRFNNRGIIGYLPIVANVSQSAVILSEKANVKMLKLVIAFASLCWVVFDLAIQAYTGAALDLLMVMAYLYGGLKKERETK